MVCINENLGNVHDLSRQLVHFYITGMLLRSCNLPSLSLCANGKLVGGWGIKKKNSSQIVFCFVVKNNDKYICDIYVICKYNRFYIIYIIIYKYMAMA